MEDNQWEAVARDNLKISGQFHVVFNTVEGKAVLAQLEALTAISNLSSNAMFDVQAELNPADCSFVREGQNQVIRYINRMLKYYSENK